jgi:hypothetical protein
VRASGRSNGTPYQDSEISGFDTPRPSRNRPAESVSSVIAVSAVRIAGRAGICITPEARAIREVAAATAPSTLGASER